MRFALQIISASAVFFFPAISEAHSFGILYNLPVPFWLYLYGGAAAMLVSFLFFGYFLNKKSSGDGENLSSKEIRWGKYFTSETFLKVLKFASVFFFGLTILSGIIGENSAYSNWNMTFFWIVFALGLTYLCALAGNIYSAINPLKAITDRLVREREEPILRYPKNLGYMPALLFYYAFIWFELLGESTPQSLSVALLIYTVITDLGVVVFGKTVWFKYCEFFSVFFGLIGRLAPVEKRGEKLYFRAPFAGLLREKAESWSLVVFIMFMLSSTAFDGFRETVVWSRFYWGNLDDFIRPILGTASYPVFQTLALIASPFFFLAIYVALIYLAKKIAKSPLSLRELAFAFALSLVPIALVYNIAHYFTLIFTEAPNILKLASDPFGWGWNLFGTANGSYGLILGANVVWHTQVAFILLGHIASVYLSHKVSLEVFPSSKKALLSGMPMLFLMIVYTMLGLWILSQPITGGTL